MFKFGFEFNVAPTVPEKAITARCLSIRAVIFEGMTASQVVRLPRESVYSGDTVWVTADGLLAKRTVKIAGSDSTTVLVSSGLMPGDAVVTTSLSLPVEGTSVSVIGGQL